MEGWADKVVEIIPDCLLEPKSYEEGDFEIIDKDTYLELKKLYAGIHASINTMIYQIYYLGCSHAYSVINGFT